MALAGKGFGPMLLVCAGGGGGGGTENDKEPDCYAKATFIGRGFFEGGTHEETLRPQDHKERSIKDEIDDGEGLETNGIDEQPTGTRDKVVDERLTMRSMVTRDEVVDERSTMRSMVTRDRVVDERSTMRPTVTRDKAVDERSTKTRD